MISPFKNEPLLELRQPSQRQLLVDALTKLDAQLPLRVPARVGSDARDGSVLTSHDPANPDRVVAQCAVASPSEVRAAVDAGVAGLVEFSRIGMSGRAALLSGAAELMRSRRPNLAALILREVGKPWTEADAEVREAIDFLEYYARTALALEERRDLLQLPGERNSLQYRPRGVTAVIGPWNFPLAIPCGMVAASLVTGNPTVLKPAEQSPACGSALVDIFRLAGVPAPALSLLPGDGSVGGALVQDHAVHTIAFTGSCPVGTEIFAQAAALQPGQHHLKRVIAEMGGKNCIIVDSDADLDDVVPAIVRSAFGYAGQKCSAASRVIAHAAVFDALCSRLAGAVDALVVGQPESYGTEVGPLIEEAAVARLVRRSADAASRGRVLASKGSTEPHGWYADAHLVTDLPEGDPLLVDELFGPLLAVESSPSIEEACARVEQVPFGLTGALFTRNPRTVRIVSERSPVGNLYVNRATTGAVVGRQPFGGRRLSGTGTKAGGSDYLLSFVEPFVMTENTMRHGLVAD